MNTEQLRGGAPDASPYRPPQDAEQKALCEIFADVLRLSRVGIDDDFFALGGRSIDGVLIAARAAVALGCPVSIADLFDAPSVAELRRQLCQPIDEDARAEWTQLP